MLWTTNRSPCRAESRGRPFTNTQAVKLSPAHSFECKMRLCMVHSKGLGYRKVVMQYITIHQFASVQFYVAAFQRQNLKLGVHRYIWPSIITALFNSSLRSVFSLCLPLTHTYTHIHTFTSAEQMKRAGLSQRLRRTFTPWILQWDSWAS